MSKQLSLLEEEPPVLYWRTFCVQPYVDGGCGYEGRRKRELKECHRCGGKVVAIPIREDTPDD